MISTMWVKENIVIKKGKTYTSTLVVESIRVGKTVKHKTLIKNPAAETAGYRKL